MALLGGGGVATTAAVRVTIESFTRVETDYYFKNPVGGCFGSVCHERGSRATDRHAVIWLNRDTPYSSAVFDLTTPVTIVKPGMGKRFQSFW